MPHWFELAWMQRLENEYSRYIREADSKPSRLLVAIAEARENIRLLEISTDLAANVSGYVTAMSVEQQAIEELKAKICSV
jgi:hypothetical protein